MTDDQAAAENARLRLELEHRDQLLASVHARADTLRASPWARQPPPGGMRPNFLTSCSRSPGRACS